MFHAHFCLSTSVLTSSVSLPRRGGGGLLVSRSALAVRAVVAVTVQLRVGGGVQLLELVRAVVGVVVNAGRQTLLVVEGALGEALSGRRLLNDGLGTQLRRPRPARAAGASVVVLVVREVANVRDHRVLLRGEMAVGQAVDRLARKGRRPGHPRGKLRPEGGAALVDAAVAVLAQHGHAADGLLVLLEIGEVPLLRLREILPVVLDVLVALERALVGLISLASAVLHLGGGAVGAARALVAQAGARALGERVVRELLDLRAVLHAIGRGLHRAVNPGGTATARA
eukprot:scaffold36091_cov67-Phaeocystis_antarctica.AAC.2